jgi:hypothetical protein
MYELTYALQTIGNYKTFEEAFIALYNRLTKDMEGPGMSWQLLETAVWIMEPGEDLPTMFYEARDRACRMGLLKDGSLNPDYKIKKKNNQIIEGQLGGGSKVVTCPECGSDDIFAVEFFDYVKQCNSCGEQFSSGIHN